jgi:phage-related holin
MPNTAAEPTFWYYVVSTFRTWGVGLIGVIGGMCAAYWDGSSEALRAALIGVLCTTVADTVLGVTIALTCPLGRFSSHRLGDVLKKLLVYMMGLLSAYGIDQVSGHILGAKCLFQLFFAAMICFREATSLLEHAAALDVPLPEVLKQRLDLTRKRVEECIGMDEEASGKGGTKP